MTAIAQCSPVFDKLVLATNNEGKLRDFILFKSEYKWLSKQVHHYLTFEGFAPHESLIFVNLNPDAPSLRTQLGDLPERLSGYRLDEWRLVRAKGYQVEANYKLVGENFMECYHLPWVHPELIKVSRLENHYRWQGPGMYTGMCTTPISQNTEAGGWQGLQPLGNLRGADAVSGRFVWLFPNAAINVLPCPGVRA